MEESGREAWRLRTQGSCGQAGGRWGLSCSPVLTGTNATWLGTHSHCFPCARPTRAPGVHSPVLEQSPRPFYPARYRGACTQGPRQGQALPSRRPR